jgi:virulence-associated protein VagC
MSHKVDRLQLIRERHRKLILEPRSKVMDFDLFDEWNEDFEMVDEHLLSRELRDRGEDE